MPLTWLRCAIVPALLLLAGRDAFAQSPGFSCSGTTCTVPAGSYGNPVSSTVTSGSSYSVTNDGTFNVFLPSGSVTNLLSFQLEGFAGVDSDSGGAGPGSTPGALTFTNSGSLTQSSQSGVPFSNPSVTLYARNSGGAGGNYTNNNGNSAAGAGAAAGDVTLVNNVTVTVNPTDSFDPNSLLGPGGATLLADSRGGNGGNSADNSGIAGNGGPGFYATTTNNAAVSAFAIQANQGYWAVAARSLGGNGGSGHDGAGGGNAHTATVTNNSPVQLEYQWTTGSGGEALLANAPFGLFAFSQGGNGSNSNNNDANGGNAGSASSASVTVNSAGTVSLFVSQQDGAAVRPGAAVGALSLGGNGGAGSKNSDGGTGGAATTAAVTLLRTTVMTSGSSAAGISALSQGGVGGSGGSGANTSNGGRGGFSNPGSDGAAGVDVQVIGSRISTGGTNSPAVIAASIGGAGGAGADYDQAGDVAGSGGNGGSGGTTAPAMVRILGSSSISASGDQSPAINAYTLGGNGGAGGSFTASEGDSGNGGAGGTASSASVLIAPRATISTTGGAGSGNAAPSFGVLASSIGGTGGTGGELHVTLGGGDGNGGAGGSAANVAITLAPQSSVTTTGSYASAVVARSIGGAGGAGGEVFLGGIANSKGDGGASGNAGTATITSGADVTTSGSNAHGLVAQSISGVSGSGGSGSAIIYGSGGDAGSGGSVSQVTVTNNATIRTSGSGALGVEAQSIGGGSGAGGSVNGGFVEVGGSASYAAAGGPATASNYGNISTAGQYAHGILAQSIGGGGGNGGDSNGVVTSIGGGGGGGGSASTVIVNLGGGISTTGGLAHGVVAQSIGGGGGNGGDATSNGIGVTLSIGGNAQGSSAGGSVTVIGTGGSISARDTKSSGIIAQSIGGGGGTGGAGYAQTSGFGFAGALAVGGSGGSGGNGNSSSVTLGNVAISTGQATATTTTTNLNPVDAFGVVVQSIGGGGGHGGSAMANAVTAGIQNPGDNQSYAASLAIAVGGAGGTGGNGSTAGLALQPGSTITTQGQGSHGALVQSIGGGGGNGGDSSAMAATLSYGRAETFADRAPDFAVETFDLDISMSIGGNGNTGGNGGTVSATLGSTNAQDAHAGIVTYGDYANGVQVQSIGGGGGNGGTGSTTTQSFGSTRNLNVSVGVGGKGGSGECSGTTSDQCGGTATVTLYPNASITTYGATAFGILAQSVGGGGGASQGGTANLGGAYTLGNNVTVTPILTGTFNWGGNGGGGGNGGTVTVDVQGAVQTFGGDAIGVVAQSIGGGGGLGGSAGADASADNPISTVTGTRSFISNVVETNLNLNASVTATLGGKGGAAGAGGQVNATHSGSITTAGDWAIGMLAQSVGGGGGKGGTAMANSSGTLPIINMSIGGSGASTPSPGGNGGLVNIMLSGGQITTGVAGGTGYGAIGLLGQSIGGSGGTMSDGSIEATGTIRIGGGWGSNGAILGPLTGDGYTVQLTGNGSVRTNGYAAPGIVLQSIGGGGGVGGSGNSLSNNLSSLTLWVGGGPDASGSGSSVVVSNAVLNIATSGSSAYGLLAQSIGGGGGLAITPANATTTLNVNGYGPSGNTGNAGAISISLASGSSITTSGIGAHGILAQSVGGGGGISAAPPAGTPTVNDGFFYYSNMSLPNAQGNGGDVVLAVNGNVAVSGAGAFGVLAQSVGNGGGIGVIDGKLWISAMGIPTQTNNLPVAGQVSITQDSGSIVASGENGVGIFAQSQNNGIDPYGYSTGNNITITINGSVQGGSGAQGRGIWISQGYNNTVTVGATGSVSALSGMAIYASSFASVFVYNYGTVYGSYELGFGELYNEGSGTVISGSTAAAATTVNAGRLFVGPSGSFGQTTFTGNLLQTPSGTIFVDADFVNHRSGVMTVQGNAALSGTILPAITSVLPDIALPVMTVGGTLSGSVTGGASTLFGYGVQRSGQTLLLSATSADFTPPGYSLSGNHAAVANHLQAIWDAGGSAPLGALFALLGNTADAQGASAYEAQLRQLSPDATFAPGARATAGAQSFANAALSCPAFDGTTAMLIEGQCGWMRVTGRSASQSNGSVADFKIDSTVWQIGGQAELAPGWFLGGSLAYETSWLASRDKLNSGNGQSGYGAVTLKYQTGAWLFSAGAFGGAGEYNLNRIITLPGFASVAKGSPDTATMGALLRATYTIGEEAFYLRPNVTLSTIHARSGAYRESGGGALNLAVDNAEQTNVILTPMLEMGGRVELGHDMLLRPFVAAGLSVLSDATWTQTARLISAPIAAGRFTTTVPSGHVVGRVAAGAQLYSAGALTLRLQYDGEFSGVVRSHAGSFNASIRF